MKTHELQNRKPHPTWARAVDFVIAVALSLASLSPAGAAEMAFVCDIANWNLSADSGFGAGSGETRGFATIPSEIPLDCLSEGWSKVNGVIVYVTRTAGGATTMEVRPEVRYLLPNGMPSDELFTSGLTDTVEDVSVFPNHTDVLAQVIEKPFRFANSDGVIDSLLASSALLNGDETPEQFIPYSRSGLSRPCYTALEFLPLIEPCFNGDPAFRSLGLGLGISAATTTLGGEDSNCEVAVRTNNPLVAKDNSLQFVLRPVRDLACSAPGLDSVTLLGPSGEMIGTHTNPPYETPLSFELSPEEAEYFEAARLLFQITHNVYIDKKPLTPAQAIFLDNFESGDLSGWGPPI